MSVDAPIIVGGDLATQGFLHLRGAVDAALVHADILAATTQAGARVDGVASVPLTAGARPLQAAVHAVASKYADAAGLQAQPDKGLSIISVSPQKGGALPWHLDHGSYFFHHDHTNYLICYLPIVKETTAGSNLAVVPYNVLRAVDPRAAARCAGRGAMHFERVEVHSLAQYRAALPAEQVHVGDWVAFDDYDDRTLGFKLGFDLEQHKVVPQLRPMDLLLMRADVIHRTADCDCRRVSIRVDLVPSEPHSLLWRLRMRYATNFKVAHFMARYRRPDSTALKTALKIAGLHLLFAGRLLLSGALWRYYGLLPPAHRPVWRRRG